jgi:hypothetical protein
MFTVLYILGYVPDADTDNLKVQVPLRVGATRYPEDILHCPLVIEYDLRPADNVVMNFESETFFFLGIVKRNTLMPGTT